MSLRPDARISANRTRPVICKPSNVLQLHAESASAGSVLPAAQVRLRTGALHEVFLDAAKNEGYEEILACILAAEWLYRTWCSTADRTPSSRVYVRDWVALHAGGAFADHVAWVRTEIDARASPRAETEGVSAHIVRASLGRGDHLPRRCLCG
jgi:thiaminase